jgi:hypothetical protein
MYYRNFSINVTAIRTNGSPITQTFTLPLGGDGASASMITSFVSTLLSWSTNCTYGGIVRWFVNIQDPNQDDSETLEFRDVDGIRSYFQEWDESRVLAQWSIEK